MLLALDPGQNSPGVALFAARHVDRGTLRAAARIAVPSGFSDLPAGARWLHVALLIREWCGSDTLCRITDVVFEKPQWYDRVKSKGDPNQLVGIAGVAAAFVGVLGAFRFADGLAVHSPEPAKWIGQLSKECPVCKSTRAMRKGSGVKTFAKDCPNCHGSAWETPRGRYIRKRLEASELALVPDQNDAIDAVGLGLWSLGRLTPHSVLSNGRDGR